MLLKNVSIDLQTPLFETVLFFFPSVHYFYNNADNSIYYYVRIVWLFGYLIV